MRALTNQCLLLVTALAFLLPNQADGQISRFFKRSTTNTRQTHAPSPRQSAAVRPRQAAAPIQRVQLEELIPEPVVPSPLTEAAVPGLNAAPAMDLNGPSNIYSAPIAPHAQSHDAFQGSTYGDQAAPMPLNGTVTESIMDTGIGQPYDIPLSNVIPQQAAETYSTSDWFRNGNWYSRQEFTMLLRADLPLQHLAVDGSALSNSTFDPNQTPSLSTKHTDFTYEAGTRLSIGHRLGRDPANRDHSVEFVFFGLFEYSGQASLTPVRPGGGGIISLKGSEESIFSIINPNPGFATINFVDGFTSNTQVDLLHKADFNSFELNYVIGGRPAKDRIVMQADGRWVRHATPSKVRGIFAGLRYVRQNDLFQYRGIGQVTQTGTDLDVGGTYLVKTDNDLVGAQIGGEFTRKRSDWIVGFKGKIGGLVNFADRVNRLSQTTASTTTGTRVVSTKVTELKLQDETLTFLGEGGAYAAYYIRPNTALRIGYDVLYMNGMATATNNLGIRGDGFARFEMTGDSLYHGMNFGLEMTW